ncbi:hypothetical protein SteCoe_27253 [Stentor coeruleus]|uniref:Uncharacterized protein n=1 Tax=Stentor coeruleus TaxID=5963 RepID=A0A1R2BBA0_9CILI|nr:hypothetical protein SteCoe_27253 [Stentor coeruleus]
MKSKKILLSTINDEIPYTSKISHSTEKKYSILHVPKVRLRVNRILRETSRDFKYTPENTQTKTYENTIKTSQEEKVSLAKIFKIKRTYRPNKMFNKENVKDELLRINFLDAKVQTNLEKNQNVVKRVTKSDIEEILESQEYLKHFKPKEKKKPGVYINLRNVCEENEKQNNLNDSVGSDPSPVKEKKVRKETPKSKTPTSFNKPFRVKNTSVHILSESRTGKEILGKIMESRNRLLKSGRRSSPKQEFMEKQFSNYQQDSLRILKNTAFFADKIMKGIRCGAKIKNILSI